MSGTPRDLLKTRVNRVGEVYSQNALKAGQPNSQLLAWGCIIAPGGTNQITVSAGEIVIAQSIVAIAAIGATSLTGATTDASTFRKVLAEVDAAGALTLTIGNGATAQALAVLPALTATRVAIGYLEIPNSFTVGSTAVTTPMIKQGPGTLVAYSAV